MTEESLNDRYRNGGEMNESEPYVRDTVDFMNRAKSDPRMVQNQLRVMGCPIEDIEEEE